ncbi:MAG: hypothetical protein V5A57_03295 [Candidatus Paceibacterota bacterium]
MKYIERFVDFVNWLKVSNVYHGNNKKLKTSVQRNGKEWDFQKFTMDVVDIQEEKLRDFFEKYFSVWWIIALSIVCLVYFPILSVAVLTEGNFIEGIFLALISSFWGGITMIVVYHDALTRIYVERLISKLKNQPKEKVLTPSKLAEQMFLCREEKIEAVLNDLFKAEVLKLKEPSEKEQRSREGDNLVKVR